MNIIRTIIVFIGLIVFTPSFSCSQERSPGVYAEFDTDKGLIVVELYYDQVPMTVINFVGLAEGTIEANRGKDTRYYDGLMFHRVIADFMIQGGDPQGNGRGGPGYKFPDEIVDELRHDSPGILSMANSGPDTNGSQFFITHKPTSWLDGKHTVFGKVVQGQKVVDSIAQGDRIKKLTITRIGKKAEGFIANRDTFKAAFDNLKKKEDEQKAKYLVDFEKRIRDLYPNAVKTKSGLMYIQQKKGKGSLPSPGAKVTMHYTGMFLSGRIFSTSTNGKPIEVFVGKGQVVPGWDEAISAMKKGEKRKLFLPHMLAYGEEGYPNMIPPKTDLVFEVEILDFE